MNKDTTEQIDAAFSQFGLNDIKSEAEQYADSDPESKGLFTLKTANKWMEEANKRPIPTPHLRNIFFCQLLY